MASKLEFERKFLLLKKPVLKADSIARIEQHYFGDERIRRKSEEGKSDVFYHTVKKNLRPGVRQRDVMFAPAEDIVGKSDNLNPWVKKNKDV
jgi:hypothetical protein